MDYLSISIAAINLTVSVVRLWRALVSRRLIAVVWLLIAYFSLFLVLLAVNGPYGMYRGFIGERVTVKVETIQYVCEYVLIFNILFALSEIGVWKIFGLKRTQIEWRLSTQYPGLSILKMVFLGFLVGGTILYWFTMQGLGYRSYVEFKESNWPIVFLWASSPWIMLNVLQKKYFLGILGIIPFLFFAFYLDIRSFALLSLVPAAIIFYFQSIQETDGRRIKITRLLAKGFVIFGIFVALSTAIMYKKSEDMSAKGGEGLPDAGIVYGMGMAFEMTKRLDVYTGYNSLIKYSLNTINPFLRLFQIETPVIEDTPVYIAFLIDGVPKGWPVYFHYPTLWYADAYVSFGQWGVLLGLLWGLILSLWERLMLKHALLIGLFLPFYVWHAYMLVRGAIAGATVPFTYAIYVVAIVPLVFGQFKFFGRGK